MSRLPWEPWYASLPLYRKVSRYAPSRIRARRAQSKYLTQLNAAIPGLHFESFGGGAPCQGFGTYKGLYAYYRFRSNVASLELFTNEEAFNTPPWDDGLVQHAALVGVLAGEPFGGWALDLDKQVEVLEELLRHMSRYHSARVQTRAERRANLVSAVLTDEDEE